MSKWWITVFILCLYNLISRIKKACTCKNTTECVPLVRNLQSQWDHSNLASAAFRERIIQKSGLLLKFVEIDMIAAFCGRKASVGLVAPAGALTLQKGKCKFDLSSSELIKVAKMRRKIMKSLKIGVMLTVLVDMQLLIHKYMSVFFLSCTEFFTFGTSLMLFFCENHLNILQSQSST